MNIGDGNTGGQLFGDVQNTGEVNFNRSNASTYSGVISGAGGVHKLGANTLTLTGANSYTGGTIIDGGTLALSGASGSIAGSVTLAATGTGFDIAGAVGGRTIDSLSGAAGSTVALGANTLTLGDATSTAFDGVISGTGSVHKQGAGTLTFGGTNTYAGGTVINGGTLALSGAGRLAGSVTLAAAGTGFDIAGAVGGRTIGSLSGVAGSTVALGANALTVGDATDTAFGGVISGTGGLTKQGTDTLTLAGANSYTGGTIIDGGTLALSGASGSIAGSVTLAATGTGFDIAGAVGGRTIGSLSGAAGSTVALGANTLTLGDATSTAFDGVISGTGAVHKQGAGTLTFGGTNTYAGGTVINGGTLALSGAGRLAGSVTLAAAGTGFDIAGAVGGRTIGSLSGVAGSTVALGANALTVGDATDTAFGGVISGTGGLTKQGTDTLTLAGANSYAGATNVDAGTLSVNGSIALLADHGQCRRHAGRHRHGW